MVESVSNRTREEMLKPDTGSTSGQIHSRYAIFGRKATARVPTHPRHPPPPLPRCAIFGRKATARVPTHPRHPPPPLLRTSLGNRFVVIVEAGVGLGRVGTLAVAFRAFRLVQSQLIHAYVFVSLPLVHSHAYLCLCLVLSENKGFTC